ncbi:MAG: hypothetical protein J6X79_04545 [Bacteroidales bacterium]|nr:hypothetical protein [Bacteroidales bacterium]
MEHNITFEELWEHEERQGLQQRLQQDYPSWLRRRRIRRTALAGIAVLVVAGISIFSFQFSISKDYDYVACNRSGIAEDHWATMAANILTKEMI